MLPPSPVAATVVRGAGAPAPSLTNPVSTPELVWASTAGAVAKQHGHDEYRKAPAERPKGGRRVTGHKGVPPDAAERGRFSPELPGLSRPAATLPAFVKEVADPTMARRKNPIPPSADAVPPKAPAASTPRPDAPPATPATAAPRLRRTSAKAAEARAQAGAAGTPEPKAAPPAPAVGAEGRVAPRSQP